MVGLGQNRKELLADTVGVKNMMAMFFFQPPYKLGCTVSPIIGTATPSRNHYSMQSNYLSLSKWSFFFLENHKTPGVSGKIFRGHFAKPCAPSFVQNGWMGFAAFALFLYTPEGKGHLWWSNANHQPQTASKKRVCNVTFQLKSVGSM